MSVRRALDQRRCQCPAYLRHCEHVSHDDRETYAHRSPLARFFHNSRSLIHGTGVVPDGPMPMTCSTTSPFLDHAKCGCFAGSVHTLPAESACIVLSSNRSP